MTWSHRARRALSSQTYLLSVFRRPDRAASTRAPTMPSMTWSRLWPVRQHTTRGSPLGDSGGSSTAGVPDVSGMKNIVPVDGFKPCSTAAALMASTAARPCICAGICSPGRSVSDGAHRWGRPPTGYMPKGISIASGLWPSCSPSGAGSPAFVAVGHKLAAPEHRVSRDASYRQ